MEICTDQSYLIYNDIFYKQDDRLPMDSILKLLKIALKDINAKQVLLTIAIILKFHTVRNDIFLMLLSE